MELRHVWSRWCIYRIPKNRRKEFDIGRTLWIPEWLKSEWMVHQQRSTNIRIGSITIITSPCFLLSEEHCIQGSRGKVLNNPLLWYDFMLKTMFLIWFHVENNVFNMISCWKQCFWYDFMLKTMFFIWFHVENNVLIWFYVENTVFMTSVLAT